MTLLFRQALNQSTQDWYSAIPAKLSQTGPSENRVCQCRAVRFRLKLALSKFIRSSIVSAAPLWKYGARAARLRSIGGLNLLTSARLPLTMACRGSVVRTPPGSSPQGEAPLLLLVGRRQYSGSCCTRARSGVIRLSCAVRLARTSIESRPRPTKNVAEGGRCRSSGDSSRNR